jgi:hypothetical protein
MTVKELAVILKALPGDSRISLSSDPEGNRIRPLGNLSVEKWYSRGSVAGIN